MELTHITGIGCSLLSILLIYLYSRLNLSRVVKTVIYILSIIMIGIGIENLSATQYSIVSWLSFIILLFLVFTRNKSKQTT